MIFKTIKRVISPSLSSMIRTQISSHKNSGYDFHPDIVCVISKDYRGPYISACLKSTNPSAGGISASQQIWFFKRYIDSNEDVFNELTIEVSKAQSIYQELNFFRWITLEKDDGKKYITKRDSLSVTEKANMVLRKAKARETTIYIFERYSAGDWFISDKPPWQEFSIGYY